MNASAFFAGNGDFFFVYIMDFVFLLGDCSTILFKIHPYAIQLFLFSQNESNQQR